MRKRDSAPAVVYHLRKVPYDLVVELLLFLCI